MAALRRVLALAALLAARPAAAQPLAPWSNHIAEASARFGVPAEWIRRVIRAESNGRTMWLGRPTVSRAGAMGLMQVMPGTWRELRAAYGLGPDPHHPHDNILAGTAYLRAMYDRFGYPGVFAAYNAGPARYALYLSGSRSLPAETRSYVAAVTSGSRAPAVSRRRAPARIFALAPAREPSQLVQQRPAADGLFVRLSSPASR